MTSSLNCTCACRCNAVRSLVRAFRVQDRSWRSERSRSADVGESIGAFGGARLERTGQQRIRCHRIPSRNGLSSASDQELERQFVERPDPTVSATRHALQRCGRNVRSGTIDFYAMSQRPSKTIRSQRLATMDHLPLPSPGTQLLFLYHIVCVFFSQITDF